jgi:hypothetical protein
MIFILTAQSIDVSLIYYSHLKYTYSQDLLTVIGKERSSASLRCNVLVDHTTIC